MIDVVGAILDRFFERRVVEIPDVVPPGVGRARAWIARNRVLVDHLNVGQVQDRAHFGTGRRLERIDQRIDHVVHTVVILIEPAHLAARRVRQLVFFVGADHVVPRPHQRFGGRKAAHLAVLMRDSQVAVIFLAAGAAATVRFVARAEDVPHHLGDQGFQVGRPQVAAARAHDGPRPTERRRGGFRVAEPAIGVRAAVDDEQHERPVGAFGRCRAGIAGLARPGAQVRRAFDLLGDGPHPGIIRDRLLDWLDGHRHSIALRGRSFQRRVVVHRPGQMGRRAGVPVAVRRARHDRPPVERADDFRFHLADLVGGPVLGCARALHEHHLDGHRPHQERASLRIERRARGQDRLARVRADAADRCRERAGVHADRLRADHLVPDRHSVTIGGRQRRKLSVGHPPAEDGARAQRSEIAEGQIAHPCEQRVALGDIHIAAQV